MNISRSTPSHNSCACLPEVRVQPTGLPLATYPSVRPKLQSAEIAAVKDKGGRTGEDEEPTRTTIR